MYSKGDSKNARHEWTPSVENIGLLSNIYIRIFSSIAGTSMFTSMSYPSLSSSTILPIPLLFSCPSASVTVQQLKTTEGRPFSLITLDQHAATILASLRKSCTSRYSALEQLSGRPRRGLLEIAANCSADEGSSDSEELDDNEIEEDGRGA